MEREREEVPGLFEKKGFRQVEGRSKSKVKRVRHQKENKMQKQQTSKHFSVVHRGEENKENMGTIRLKDD